MLFPFPGIFEEIITVDYPYRFTKTYQKKCKASGDNIEATDNTYIHAKTNRNTNTNIHTDANNEIQKQLNLIKFI